MRYWFDTEFYENGLRIHPISLGMIAEDDRQLYLEFKHDHLILSPWLQKNVAPHLIWTPEERLTPAEGANRIVDFVSTDDQPEFWSYISAYDWVLFCQLFGTMMNMPRKFPRFCRDVQQLWDFLGQPDSLKPAKPENEHHALADAIWTRDYWINLNGRCRVIIHE